MHFVTHGDQHRAQRRLVHGWQQHTERNEEKEYLVQFLPKIPGTEPLQHDRRKFDEQHQDIGCHAEADFQHDCVEVHMPGQQNIVELPPTAHIDKRAYTAQRIAEKTRQQCRAQQRMVLALVGHIDNNGQRIAAAGKRGADHDVVYYPETPGIAAVQVGDKAHPVDKAYTQVVDGDQKQHAEHQERGGDHTAVQWLMLAHDSSPSSSFILRRTT